MNVRFLASVLAVALALVVPAGCGGGSSSDNNSAATSSADNSAAMNSAADNSAATNSAAGDSGATGSQTPMDCGAVKAVWVNLKTKAYHEPNDPYYGKTKHGEYLCPSAAKAQGFHPAGGGMHKKGSSDSSSM